MAESLTQKFHGKTDWVYVGRGNAEQKKPEKKEDALYHKYLQEVFDIATPIALSERGEAGAVQGNLAMTTAEAIKQLHDGMKTKGVGAHINALDTKLRGRELPNRMGRLLTFFVLGAGSFGLDRMGDVIAQKKLFKLESATLWPFKPINLKNSGNKAALEVGWEFLTDELVGKTADAAAQYATNRENIGFVSPLSRTLAAVGNTIVNVTGAMFEPGTKNIRMVNSFVNPGFIESAFRFGGAIPVAGALVERAYAAANRQIMQSKGIVPFATNLAYNMLIAKQFSTPAV